MPQPDSAAYVAARRRLDPLIAEIAAGAVTRDVERSLPRAEVGRLLEAGLGRLRIPVALGGDGLTIPEIAEILVDLATADSNVPQIFRGHLAFVEGLLRQADGPTRTTWLGRLTSGEFVGSAWSDAGAALGQTKTVARRIGDDLVIDGRKFYTTGSIFADWADVTATLDGEAITVAVSTHQPGVRIHDDWDGFGQRLTGTGTIEFAGASAAEADITPSSAHVPYETALFQLILLTVLAGIAAAAERDLAEQVRTRARAYSHGSAALPKDDPLVLAIVGEVSATAFTARALVREVAAAIEAAATALESGGTSAAAEASISAEIAAAQAQSVLSVLVPQAATTLFGALGASATGRSKDLDRHWRNARTVASHNPAIYKQRIVGDWAVNGTTPPFTWLVEDVSTASERS